MPVVKQRESPGFCLTGGQGQDLAPVVGIPSENPDFPLHVWREPLLWIVCEICLKPLISERLEGRVMFHYQILLIYIYLFSSNMWRFFCYIFFQLQHKLDSAALLFYPSYSKTYFKKKALLRYTSSLQFNSLQCTNQNFLYVHKGVQPSPPQSILEHFTTPRKTYSHYQSRSH